MAFIDRYKVRPEGTGSFFNYYGGMPDIEPTFEKPPEEVVPVETTDPSLRPRLIDQGDGETETQTLETQANLNGVAEIKAVDFGEIKYNSFDDYLNTTELKIDKSGMFSKIDMPRNPDAKTYGRAANLAGVTFMNPGMILGGTIAQQFDTRTFPSPLGQDRFVQTTGIGNIVGLKNLQDEYADLNEIKQDKLNNLTTNPAYDYLNFDYGFGMDLNLKLADVAIDAKTGLRPTDMTGFNMEARAGDFLEGFGNQYAGALGETGSPDMKVGAKTDFINIGYGFQERKDTGFAVMVGNNTVYRKQGSTLYKGLPSGITQNVAKTVEALLSNQNPREFNPNSGETSALVSKTSNGNLLGGYTLDGKAIQMNGDIAMMGSMKQFEAMAATNFKFGNLTNKEAQGFARSWMEGARGRNFKSQEEKIAHLNRFQELAKKAGGTVGKTVKTKTNILNYVGKNFPNAKNYSSRREDDRTVANLEKKEEQFKKETAAVTTPEDSQQAATRGGDYGVSSDIYSDFGTVSDDGGDGFDSGGVGQGGDSYGGVDFAEGGRVDMAMGSGEEEIMLDDNRVEPIIEDDDMIISGNELLADEKTKKSGFINKPASQTSDQEGIADDTPIQLRNDQNPEGATIVMNKPSIDLMGEKDFIKMVKDGLRYLRSKGKALSENDDEYIKKNFTDVAISSGEAVIQPELANVIGRKRLLALNERGKRRVSKAKRQSASEGGFIKKKFGEEVEGSGFITQPITRDVATFTAFKNFLKKRKPLRADIENFIDTIPGDKSRLGLLAGVEAPLETSTLPELEAIIQTIVNRVNDKTYEYRNINTIKEIMKQRSTRGTGSKMFMYDGLERKHIRPRIQEILKNPKVFQAGLDAAENVLTKGGGEPDYEMEMLPPDVFQYSVAGKPSAVNDNNPKLKFYKKIGKHNFYRRIP